MVEPRPNAESGTPGSRRAWVWSRRKIVRLFAVVGAIAFLAALILPTLRSPPNLPIVHHIESLNDPVIVIGGDEQGLLLADGRQVGLPGIKRLPKASLAIERVTGSGVEVTPEGRVVGLLNVRPFCGQDNVRIRIMRVDVAHLMMYLGEVEIDRDRIRAAGERRSSRVDSFGGRGWRISDYLDFDAWSKAASAAGL